MKTNWIGGWAFILGIVIAIIVGILGALTATYATILVVLGIIVGFLNVTGKEVTPFLLAAVALIIATSFGGAVFEEAIPMLKNILDAILALVVPAVIVVSLREVFEVARER